MSTDKQENEEQLPKWTKPKQNFVGINLNDLSPAQIEKLIKFMEEIKYEPIQFSKDDVTKD